MQAWHLSKILGLLCHTATRYHSARSFESGHSARATPDPAVNHHALSMAYCSRRPCCNLHRDRYMRTAAISEARRLGVCYRVQQHMTMASFSHASYQDLSLPALSNAVVLSSVTSSCRMRKRPISMFSWLPCIDSTPRPCPNMRTSAAVWPWVV